MGTMKFRRITARQTVTTGRSGFQGACLSARGRGSMGRTTFMGMWIMRWISGRAITGRCRSAENIRRTTGPSFMGRRCMTPMDTSTAGIEPRERETGNGRLSGPVSETCSLLSLTAVLDLPDFGRVLPVPRMGAIVCGCDSFGTSKGVVLDLRSSIESMRTAACG